MENESPFEAFPQPIRPMMRLRYDVLLKDEYKDLLFAAIAYLEAELGEHAFASGAIDCAIADGAVISEEKFDQNKRQGLEQFRMIPLELVASYIDVSMSIQDLEVWYKTAAETAVQEIEPTHNDDCLKGGNWPVYTCQHSHVCPKRKTRDILMGSILNADFESLEYQFDEQRVWELNNVKKQAAIHAGVVNEVDASMYWAIYEQRRPHAMEQK